MRMHSSIVNAASALAGQGVSLLVSFVARKFFIVYLGEVYLGLNGLFSNILSVLSLVELGIGPAIIFSLYKPLAENDNETVMHLMSFYKKAYTIIGILIGAMGLVSIPLLPFLIKEIPNIPHISLIYFLFIFNSTSAYFFSYKRSLIIADQKQYIFNIYHYNIFVLMNIIQILVLHLTQNYLLFLCIQICSTIGENIIISIKANKLYPYLKNKPVGHLSHQIGHQIFKNTAAMFCHKIGSVVVNSTDNIIMAAKVSIVSVGYYSNYQLIIQALKLIMTRLFAAITASVGNLGATESVEKSHSIFKILYFFNFWAVSFSSVCLYVLFNPFISLAFGKNLLFPMNIVAIIIFNYYITGLRQATLTFKDALGLYWYDRFKPLFEVVINLVVSLTLAEKFGIMGIFIGTAVSTITTCFWVEPLVLYKYGFKRPPISYFLKYFLYTAIALFSFFCTVIIADGLFVAVTWGNLFGRAVICVLVPNIIIIVIFYRTSEFQYLYGVLTTLIRRIIKRKK